jgi:hypothetical protein
MRILRTPNCTFDLYVLPNEPPGIPDLQGTGYLHSWFFPGMQINRGKSTFFFDSALDVDETTAAEDPWTAAPGSVRLYIPDMWHQGYDVIFVERVREPSPHPSSRGWGIDFKRLFLKRRWLNPYNGLIMEGGISLGGTSAAARGFSGSGGLQLAAAALTARGFLPSGGIALSGSATKRGKATFFSSTTWTVPAGTTSVTISCLGGGGGGDGSGPTGAGGGGAGAAASLVLIVSPGDVITINVGAGGTQAHAGGDTWASKTGAPPANTSQGALAKGGTQAVGTNGGQGGQAGASIGSSTSSGGNGGNVPGGGPFGGGGGGGAGFGNHANGQNGTNPNGGAGGAGDSGTGGAGGNNGQPGNNATGTGSGCGGGGGATGQPAGQGKAGQVTLSW